MSTHSNEARATKMILTAAKPSESDDNHEKGLIALHALKSYYSHTNNRTYAKLEAQSHEGDYIDFDFRFDSDSVPSDEHNNDVYVKITCSICWLDNQLNCRASLNSETMGDDCSLFLDPASLALQHQVNESCKKLIEEQRQVLADAGINLSAVNDTPEWNYSFFVRKTTQYRRKHKHVAVSKAR